MLLVAHCNHSKLKHAVERYLIQFGRDFGLVIKLMASYPTRKMVEAVSEAYAAFSKFLAKAIGFYKESKLKSALKSFAFPWETKFEAVVGKIQAAFVRIKELADAGHIGMTVKTQRMIENLGTGQEELHKEMRRGTIELKEQLRLEMKNEFDASFQMFTQNWTARVDELMIQSMVKQQALPDRPRPKSLPALLAVPEIEYARSLTDKGSSRGMLSSCYSCVLHLTSVVQGRPHIWHTMLRSQKDSRASVTNASLI